VAYATGYLPVGPPGLHEAIAKHENAASIRDHRFTRWVSDIGCITISVQPPYVPFQASIAPFRINDEVVVADAIVARGGVLSKIQSLVT
jgi:hypothetical protein